MNTQTTIDAWIVALRYLIDEHALSEPLRTTAKTTLATYERSLKLHNLETQNAHELLTNFRQREKELRPQLIAELYAGRKSTLGTTTAEVQHLESAWESAQLRTRITTGAHNQITHQLCGGAVMPYAGELFQWIATRRNSAPQACGEIDALPAPVQLIYKTISPRWRTDWEPALTLDGIRQLPLIFDAHWVPELRASLAWVWEQVANGHTQQVPHPHDKRPNPPCQLLAPTRRVTTLPTVPPIPATPRTNRTRT
jgi:hypothetical protein